MKLNLKNTYRSLFRWLVYATVYVHCILSPLERFSNNRLRTKNGTYKVQKRDS